jgi:UDP-N-acetylmuramyl pentapeptide phosphotransferase/UDP-N-acetylglucosamine-1-phosphate transferase
MSDPFLIWLLTASAISAGVLSWAGVAVLIRLAPRFGLMDRPNHRSLHSTVTPRGGGIGLVAVVMLGGIILVPTVAPSPVLPLVVVLLAALSIAEVSLHDDFHPLAPGLRLACHFAAAAIVVWVLGGFRWFDLPGGLVADFHGFGTVLTVVWIVGLTNVYNFMDGIDGLAGLQGVMAGAAWATAGLVLRAPVIVVLGGLLAGGGAGFLVHNWSPAKIFMGDVGSAFLGFSFGVLPLLALGLAARAGAPPEFLGRLPVFAALVVWPFVADGLLTFIRRALKREKVWTAHRSHLYQRLVQNGWSHAQVTVLYGSWAAAAVVAGCGYLLNAVGGETSVVAFMVLSLLAMFGFVSVWERLAGRDGG